MSIDIFKLIGFDASNFLIGAAFGSVLTAVLFLLFAWISRNFKTVLLISAILGAISLLKLAW